MNTFRITTTREKDDQIDGSRCYIMDMTDPLLSSQEAQKVLKVSRQTLWRLEKMGAVTPVKIGTVKRYLSSEITGAKKIK